jgi:hypothetical protein
MRKGFVISVVVIMGFCAVGRGQEQPLPVSLVQLIANPERYDGKLVNVEGFLPFGGVDGDEIFLGKADYENGIQANGVWVERTKQMLRDRAKLYSNYVVIEGVFRREKKPPSYLPHLAGRITDIRRCQFVSDPDHPVAKRLREMRGEEPK